MQRALQHHLDVLELLTPARWVGAIDDVAFDGEYLLFEVLTRAPLAPTWPWHPARRRTTGSSPS